MNVPEPISDLKGRQSPVNREIMCEQCGGLLLFLDNTISIQENVWRVARVERSHKCGADPRTVVLNAEMNEKWELHLAMMETSLSESEYFKEQLNFCWEAMSQLNFALQVAHAVKLAEKE